MPRVEATQFQTKICRFDVADFQNVDQYLVVTTIPRKITNGRFYASVSMRRDAAPPSRAALHCTVNGIAAQPITDSNFDGFDKVFEVAFGQEMAGQVVSLLATITNVATRNETPPVVFIEWT